MTRRTIPCFEFIVASDISFRINVFSLKFTLFLQLSVFRNTQKWATVFRAVVILIWPRFEIFGKFGQQHDKNWNCDRLVIKRSYHIKILYFYTKNQKKNTGTACCVPVPFPYPYFSLCTRTCTCSYSDIDVGRICIVTIYFKRTILNLLKKNL